MRITGSVEEVVDGGNGDQKDVDLLAKLSAFSCAYSVRTVSSVPIFSTNPLKRMVGAAGFEPATPAV